MNPQWLQIFNAVWVDIICTHFEYVDIRSSCTVHNAHSDAHLTQVFNLNPRHKSRWLLLYKFPFQSLFCSLFFLLLIHQSNARTAAPIWRLWVRRWSKNCVNNSWMLWNRLSWVYHDEYVNMLKWASSELSVLVGRMNFELAVPLQTFPVTLANWNNQLYSKSLVSLS